MRTRRPPILNRACDVATSMEGEIGRRLEAVTEQWILPTPLANPAILEMFRDRDRKPLQNRAPWAGEYAGKYLTHAVQICRLTRDKRLKDHIKWFVKELISLQAKDGYLGPFPAGSHLTRFAPNSIDTYVWTDNGFTYVDGNNQSTWDAWGHYHIMLGLILWHDLTGDTKALGCARKIADLFCNKFLNSGKRLVSVGSTEMNLAPIHALCLLYERTGQGRYLAMAKEIEKDFRAKSAGDYIRQALAGKEFYQTPKPRWESLHPIQGIAELYFITGQDKYRQAFEQIWWSIVKLDRHNNGGFSSWEKAQGNPYHPGSIETCCTVAWMALSVDMLRMTGTSIVADELELSTLNSGLGMMSPSGRWVTYNTPMEGRRTASPVDCTAFQARPGQPELNCCSVNGPRALGIIDDWALMTDGNGLVVNYYGPCEMTASLAKKRITIQQTTNYPMTGKIILRIQSKQTANFCLKLRIPHWSAETRVSVNGKSVGKVVPGEYLAIERKWRSGDLVRLNLDMSLHYWVGEKECRGKTAIFRGPILLAYDPRFNEIGPAKLPALDSKQPKGRRVSAKSWLEPWMLWEYTAIDGRKLRLCDYASAGAAGDPYKSWLAVRNISKARFSRQNPLRSKRN